jgi:uncharacterized protein YjiS (DUF1127 family)
MVRVLVQALSLQRFRTNCIAPALCCIAVNRAIAGHDQQPSAPIGCITSALKEQTMLISLIALIRRYARYRSDLASIRHLDERTLRDIGISHGELARYAQRYDGRRPYP